MTEMPNVSRQEGNRGCPYCHTPCGKFHKRMMDDERTGLRTRFAGEYYSCECGSLTFSPRTGEFNLRMNIELETSPRSPRVRKRAR